MRVADFRGNANVSSYSVFQPPTHHWPPGPSVYREPFRGQGNCRYRCSVLYHISVPQRESPCHERHQFVAANPPFQHQRKIPVTGVRIGKTRNDEATIDLAEDGTSFGVVPMQRFKLQSKAARQAHLGYRTKSEVIKRWREGYGFRSKRNSTSRLHTDLNT